MLFECSNLCDLLNCLEFRTATASADCKKKKPISGVDRHSPLLSGFTFHPSAVLVRHD